MDAKKRRQIPARKPAPQPSAREEWQWLEEWAGPALTAIVFVALTIWSWRKWPDLLVDFGQQLYVPWQLVEGKYLYKDIAFLHGPLSQHFNALWFRLFGPSLTVIVLINLAILAGVTAVIYRIVRLFGDRLTATAACLTFLCVFGFSQYVGIGNYNYVTPYTHEAAHGAGLTAGIVLLMSFYLQRGGRGAFVGAGLCLGLALLTKVDVALAALAVAGSGLAAGLPLTKAGGSPINGIDLTLFGGMALAPVVAFFIYFLSYLPVGQAAAAVGGAFFSASGEVAQTPFYRRAIGLDDIAGNLGRMAGMFAWVALFVSTAAALDGVACRCSRRPLLVGATLGIALFLGLILKPDLLPWAELPRALPLTTLLALTVFAALFLKHRNQEEIRSAIVPMLLWGVFGLALLAKALLNVHLYHYGFYLAMPATLVLAVCLIYWMPRGLKSTFGCGIVFRSLALAVLSAGIVYHLGWSQEFYRSKNFAVGKGGDTIFTYSPAVHAPGKIVAAALQWIEENTLPGATFVALPEGIMLNYLSRRETTALQLNFMMTEMIVFGEETMLAGFQARPPDYVVLVHKDTSEWGVGPFGRDNRNGRRIMRWVNQNYEPVVLFGEEPFESRAFGIRILRRVP